MATLTKLLATAVVLGGLDLAPAYAQFRPAPGAGLAPNPNYQFSSSAGVGQAPGNTGTPGYIPNPPPNYGPGPGGYYPNYPGYQGRYGGYLSGSADLVNAQGNFLNSAQQSRITDQQAIQAKVDTQRKIFDERQYELANTPTLEEQRETTRQQELARSRNDPPLTEIWSAKALNDLLGSVQKLHNLNLSGPMIPLDGDVLQHIEVTSGATYGGLGVLKEPDRLQWPLVLKGADYAPERNQIDQLAPQAVQQAASNNVSADTINQMTAAVDSLGGRLRQNVSNMTPTQYIQSKRYLNELTSAIQVLQDPMVSNYITQKWSARGNDVAALTREMTRQGLRFAPATAGDQAAYVALHNALVAYDTGLQRQSQVTARR